MRGSFRAAVAVLAGAGGLALAAPALAATNQPIAATGGAEATFTLPGGQITVGVTLDPTTGDITAVSVDPNAIPAAPVAAGTTPGSADPLVATADSPTKVRFETADGTTKVTVKAKKSSLSIGVRTDSLDKLVGKNSWKGNVFPNFPAVVDYTIGNDNGAPTFAFGTLPAGTADTTVTDLGTWNGSKGDDDDDSMSAGGRLAFDNNGFRKTLTIAVRVHTDDGQTRASLSVTLVGKDIQTLPLAKLVGDKTWEGVLCDGKKASISYTVAADATGNSGTVTVTKTDPADAVTNPSRNGVTVKFASGDKVSIKLFTPANGDASLKIDRKGRECTGTPTSVADPKVNTPVSTTAPGEHKRDGKGRGKDGSATTTSPGGSTSTSVAGTAATNAAGRNNGGNNNGGRNRGGNGGGDNGNDG